MGVEGLVGLCSNMSKFLVEVRRLSFWVFDTWHTVEYRWCREEGAQERTVKVFRTVTHKYVKIIGEL